MSNVYQRDEYGTIRSVQHPNTGWNIQQFQDKFVNLPLEINVYRIDSKF